MSVVDRPSKNTRIEYRWKNRGEDVWYEDRTMPLQTENIESVQCRLVGVTAGLQSGWSTIGGYVPPPTR